MVAASPHRGEGRSGDDDEKEGRRNIFRFSPDLVRTREVPTRSDSSRIGPYIEKMLVHVMRHDLHRHLHSLLEPGETAGVPNQEAAEKDPEMRRIVILGMELKGAAWLQFVICVVGIFSCSCLHDFLQAETPTLWSFSSVFQLLSSPPLPSCSRCETTLCSQRWRTCSTSGSSARPG